MKNILLIFIFLFSFSISDAQQCTNEEMKLYNMMMQYRKERGLPLIPLSKSLTKVSQIHVKDLMENYDHDNTCNMHSWSSKGNWTNCCYTRDHAKASCMWSKPSELTNYQGYGYEIAHWSSDEATALSALEGWKSSSGHHALIINEGMWNRTWGAVGVGINGNYAVIWFGHETDSEK